MEKQIITFSANEQRLIKTGGIECYASNIVSYIEAHFDLGANWSGYDSVRAVWSNDNNMAVISTVLDSNGICVVPFEVLKTKGIVKVNLVGSISVSDVLTDRLTTFPCEAVKVTAKAKIEGSETQPITPSQFEQFVAVVISEVEKVTGMTAQAETLPAGSQATARYENGILYLGIPQGIQGERGETGADGNGIAQVLYNSDYSITFVFTNGERFTTPSLRGETGPQGQPGQNGRDGTDGRDGADGVTPNLSVGNVTTLEPSEDAYVTRRGTDANPIFDFGIPKGDKGDTGEVTMSQLSSLLPTDTASGSIASFPDGTDLFPALSVKAQIEPIQDLHGYDKPWSGGAEKNKLDKEYLSNFANYTITIGSYKYTDKIQLKPNTNYVITATNKTAMSSALYYVLYHVNGSDPDKITPDASEFLYPVYDGRVSQNDNYTKFTTGETGVIRFGVANATALAEIMSTDWQLEEGNTATSWTPYSNICPISGHTDVVTEVCGVNVWDEEWEVGAYNTSTGEKISGNNIRSKNMFRISPNTIYRFTSVTTTSALAIPMLFYDADGVFVEYILNSANSTFITPSNAQYMAFYCGVAYGTTYKNDISINYPSTDHDYHAYDGNTYTTTLGRTVYGGTLDVVSGELTVTHEAVDLGSLTWTYRSANKFFYASISGKKTYQSATDYPILKTSIYPFKGNIGIGADTTVDGAIWNRSAQGSTDIIIKDTAYSDATAFKTAMSGQTLYYPLATPQTYQLDPTEVDLLLGQNNLWTDCGAVEVTYKADVGLYIDKKLSSNGTRSLSMGLTKSATAEAETETEPSKTEVETKTEETKTEASKTETETEAVEAGTEEVKTEPSKTETDTETR